MSLHPEVLKEIEAGPQYYARNWVGKPFMVEETPRQFASRIAVLAVEKERARCASIAFAHMNADEAHGREDYGLGYSDAAEHIGTAITRGETP